MKTLEIKKSENKDKSILSILKTLYSEGNQIKSLEEIESFLTLYNQSGILVINVEDEIVESLNFIKEKFGILLTIK